MQKILVSENIAPIAGGGLGRSDHFPHQKYIYFATWPHWSHLHWFAGLRSNDFLKIFKFFKIFGVFSKNFEIFGSNPCVLSKNIKELFISFPTVCVTWL